MIAIYNIDMNEIVQNLTRLTSNDMMNQVKTAVNKGADIVLNDARRRAPHGPTGNLKKGIKKKRRRGARGEALVSVGWTQTEASHGMLIEFGHQVYARGTKGDSARGKKKPAEGTQRAKAVPHLRPAGRENANLVARTIAEELSADKIAQRLFKTIARRAARSA